MAFHFDYRSLTNAVTVPDYELLLVLATVFGILALQLTAILILLRRHNLRDKAKWKRLRLEGVVIVDGPAMTWVAQAPPRPTFSTFNLRQGMDASRNSVPQ